MIARATPNRRLMLLLSGAVLVALFVIDWRRPEHRDAPAPTQPEAVALPRRSRALPALFVEPAPKGLAQRPLEYASDGVPYMPAGPDDPHPETFVHPHPITPRHIRIFTENALLFQLNEAVDGQEAPRLRRFLQQYRDEFPEDPQSMQGGYALIADCLERPGDPTVRAAAQRFFAEEIASTLRRFVHRICLERRE